MSLRWSNDNGLDVVRLISADGQRRLRFEKWRDDDECDACCDDDGVDCSRCSRCLCCCCCCIERCSDKSMLLICHSVRAVIRFLLAGAESVNNYVQFILLVTRNLFWGGAKRKKYEQFLAPQKASFTNHIELKFDQLMIEEIETDRNFYWLTIAFRRRCGCGDIGIIQWCSGGCRFFRFGIQIEITLDIGQTANFQHFGNAQQWSDLFLAHIDLAFVHKFNDGRQFRPFHIAHYYDWMLARIIEK